MKKAVQQLLNLTKPDAFGYELEQKPREIIDADVTNFSFSEGQKSNCCGTTALQVGDKFDTLP